MTMNKKREFVVRVVTGRSWYEQCGGILFKVKTTTTEKLSEVYEVLNNNIDDTLTTKYLRKADCVIVGEFFKEERKSSKFVESFNEIAKEINQTAIEKGWWKGERNEGEIIALIHSELSEALEALRHGNPLDNHIPEFSGVEAEYADVIIRIMDIAEAKGYRVAEALEAKVKYNKTRPYKHGGKKF